MERSMDLDIVDFLKMENYRRVFEACEEAKSSSDIAESTGIDGGDCAGILRKLENNGAVEYTKKGWRQTDHGNRLYRKYFG